MSLRGFHIFFIAIATLFCASFGTWALFLNQRYEGGPFIKILGAITLTLALALLAYGYHFIRKTKNTPT